MNIGSKIDDFLGLDTDGLEVRCSDYEGYYIALYFYPKDNTAGCTKQACSLRDAYTLLRQAGMEVIGVSRDSAKSHRKFIEQHSLPFRLIVDQDLHLNKAFGVWKEKSMYGRKYMGTERTTFIINPKGEVEEVLYGRAVNLANHGTQLLDWLDRQRSGSKEKVSEATS